MTNIIFLTIFNLGNGVQVDVYNTQAGHMYAIERSADLVTWTTEINFEGLPTRPFLYKDPFLNNNQEFYRVEDTTPNTP